MTLRGANDPLLGTHILGYRVTARLGNGSFGTVYRGERISFANLNEPGFGTVAIKCIERRSLTKSGQDNLVSEIATLKKVSHPHIVRLIDFWWDQSRVYLLTEFCAGGDLASYIHTKGALPEHVVQKMTSQLVDALHYMHEQIIVHLDIKPQNILLTSQVDPDIKLADFGFARNIYEPIKTLVGSLLYMSPEMVRDGIVDAKADMWSLGTVLYELMYGIPLFGSKSEEELLVKLMADEPIKLPVTPRTSKEFRDVIFHLLQRNPNQRLSIVELRSHGFILPSKHTPPSSHSLPVAPSEKPGSSLRHSRPASTPAISSFIDSSTLNVANEITRVKPDCVDNLAQALHFLELAMDSEKRRNWSEAYQWYSDAVGKFLPIHQSIRSNAEASADLKIAVYKMIDKWLKKGEQAKAKSTQASLGNQSTLHPSSCGQSSSSLPVTSFDRATTPLVNAQNAPPSRTPSPSATSTAGSHQPTESQSGQSGAVTRYDTLAASCRLH